MSSQDKSASPWQRNALIPGFIALLTLLVAPLFPDAGAFLIIRFIVAILAVIVGWFAVQARQWWWVPIFAVIVVVWNPLFPLDLPASTWQFAGFGAAIVFLVAGILIRVPREESESR